MAANGEAKTLTVEQYALVDSDKNTATPDPKVLASSLVTLGAAPRPTTLTTDASFRQACTTRRHCVALFVNGTSSSSDRVREATRGVLLGGRRDEVS